MNGQLSFGDDSLAVEKERVESERWESTGTTCAACGQFVKVYRRNIYGTQAVQLVKLAKAFYDKPAWYDVDGRDLCKLTYWGLVEREPAEEGKTSKPGTRWKPTSAGVSFARGECTVPKYSFICNKTLLHVSKETVHIRDVLPEGFDYHSIWKTEEVS